MPKRTILSPDQYLDVPFPVLGLNVVTPLVSQAPMTTPAAINVRSWDQTTQRNRGGSRPGLTEWRVTSPAGSTNSSGQYVAPGLAGATIQEMVVMPISYGTLANAEHPPPVLTLSPSGYLTLLAVVVGGKLVFAISGDTNFYPLVPGSPTPTGNPAGWYTTAQNVASWNTTGVVRGTTLNQKFYAVDGTYGNASYWDPSVSTTTGGKLFYGPDVTPPHTGGWRYQVRQVRLAGDTTTELPGTTSDPQLICTWRGRIVLSALPQDPNNWFMSASKVVGVSGTDPALDWNYFPNSPSPSQAISGDIFAQGKIGEPVTALIPYTDDVLVIGASHSIYMMQGDPMAGGAIQLISTSMGIAFGNAWCMDPYGNIYFLSSRGGVFTMTPGSQPQRISQSIEPLLTATNATNNANFTTRMLWNDQQQGIHIFVTPNVGPSSAFNASNTPAATHYFYDLRNGAWWIDQFSNNFHNPLAVANMDGYPASDRLPLIGSFDGMVRRIDPAATTDDGVNIPSFVYLGPILSKNFDDMLLQNIQALLGSASGAVTYNILVGDTPEHALAAGVAPFRTGLLKAGRNLSSLIRGAGHAIYIQLTANQPWIFEAMRAQIRGEGVIRMRGH